MSLAESGGLSKRVIGEPMSEIGTTPIAEAIGVVCWSAVGNAFGGTSIGIAEVVGLEWLAKKGG